MAALKYFQHVTKCPVPAT